jgi:hypothetical protein
LWKQQKASSPDEVFFHFVSVLCFFDQTIVEQINLTYDNGSKGGGDTHQQRYWQRTILLVVLDVVALFVLFWFTKGIVDYGDWATVVAASIASLFGLNVVIISALTASETIEVMRHQEREARLQRKATEDTVKLTERIVTEMAAQRAQADTQIAQTTLQLASTRDQTIQMIAALERTDTLIEQTERHFQITERPILRIERVKADFSPDVPIKPSIKIHNWGRTAATNVNISVKVDWGWEADFSLTGTPRFQFPLVAANDFSRLLVEESDAFLRACDKQTHDAIIQGDEFIYVFGDGTYDDLSGKSYSLERWLFSYSPRVKKFVTILDSDQVIAFTEAVRRVRAAERVNDRSDDEEKKTN